MNMKLPAVVTPPTYIYHSFSNCKTFWEEEFSPVNMTTCGRRNVKKHRDIKNGRQHIILEISYKIYCVDKRELTSLESKDYMVRLGKGMTTSLYLRTKSPNKKQDARFPLLPIMISN